MKNIILKFWIPWVFGSLVGVFLLNFILKGVLGWEHIISMAITGLIAVLIASRIKSVVKKYED
ncbi:hypothetical protein [Bacillus sp. FJAT-45066]|uniref:hypothetical protein n=1 Tax=Bacillus sp. FJAT-45066 TaxID=2011010 RepID=UPI000BB758C0|nr:hypothetical protein [Bacillus sp. FJAT-45066]